MEDGGFKGHFVEAEIALSSRGRSKRRAMVLVVCWAFVAVLVGDGCFCFLRSYESVILDSFFW
jgi:hypothetical protein